MKKPAEVGLRSEAECWRAAEGSVVNPERKNPPLDHINRSRAIHSRSLCLAKGAKNALAAGRNRPPPSCSDVPGQAGTSRYHDASLRRRFACIGPPSSR
jgi:hypothetical protein